MGTQAGRAPQGIHRGEVRTARMLEDRIHLEIEVVGGRHAASSARAAVSIRDRRMEVLASLHPETREASTLPELCARLVGKHMEMEVDAHGEAAGIRPAPEPRRQGLGIAQAGGRRRPTTAMTGGQGTGLEHGRAM